MRTVIAGASFKPSGHSPQVGKSVQPRQTLSVLAARAAADFPDALFGCLVWLHHSERDRGTRGGSGRPRTAPKTTRKGLNHTFVRYARSDTLAQPLRTRLQFIRQAFPASAEKQTDSSLLLPTDWCLSSQPSPSSRSVVSESLHSRHITGALNSLSARVHVTTTTLLSFFGHFLCCAYRSRKGSVRKLCCVLLWLHLCQVMVRLIISSHYLLANQIKVPLSLVGGGLTNTAFQTPDVSVFIQLIYFWNGNKAQTNKMLFSFKGPLCGT